MGTNNPVIEALSKLEVDQPDAIKALIEAYLNSGLESLDESWRLIIKKVLDEDQ